MNTSWLLSERKQALIHFISWVVIPITAKAIGRHGYYNNSLLKALHLPKRGSWHCNVDHKALMTSRPRYSYLGKWSLVSEIASKVATGKQIQESKSGNYAPAAIAGENTHEKSVLMSRRQGRL